MKHFDLCDLTTALIRIKSPQLQHKPAHLGTLSQSALARVTSDFRKRVLHKTAMVAAVT